MLSLCCLRLKPLSHCPGSTPVCPGEGKPVYRHKPGIISLKNDFVLTFPVLPRCSYGFRNEGPRWSHGSSRFYPGFIPVSPGSTTVRPGVALVVHGAVPVTAGRVTVCAGGVTVLPRFTPVCRAVNYLISQCCYMYDGFIHMKTKLHTVHVRAYKIACWYFGKRGNT